MLELMLLIGLIDKEAYYNIQGLKWPWYRVLWHLVSGKPIPYVTKKDNPMADFQSARDPEGMALIVSLEELREGLIRLEDMARTVMLAPTRVLLLGEIEVLKAKVEALQTVAREGK